MSIDYELAALKALGAWDPEPFNIPEVRTALDTKWVFRIKQDHEVKITRFKARLVARGFSQQWGKTMTRPIAEWRSVRV